MNEQITKWASLQDWEHAQAVVGLGLCDDRDFIDTAFRCNPGVKIFLFDPSKKKGCPEDKVFVSSELQDLRADIIDNMRLNGNFIFARNPDFRGEVEDNVIATVEEAKQYFLTMQHTSRYHALDWAEVGFEILPMLFDKALFNFFPEIFKGRPGIVVGAGPSLDKCLSTLKEIQDRVVIFSSNSAAVPLFKAGIKPHFVAAIEKKGLSIKPLIGHDVMKTAYLVPGIHTYPPIYGVECRNVFPGIQMVGPVGQWLCNELKIDPLHTGGSVSTVAYRLADKVGCDPIILVGCDCSQGVDNATPYAANVQHKTDGYEDSTVAKVPAWGGIGFVSAPAVLNTYRHWFENRIEEKRASLINASIGGARIRGWIEKELKDIDVGEKLDVFDVVDSAAKDIPFLDLSGIKSGLENQINISSKSARHAREALKAARALDIAIRGIVESQTVPNITMSCAVSQIGEFKMLPNEAQVKAVINKMARINECHFSNRGKIRNILKGLKNVS